MDEYSKQPDYVWDYFPGGVPAATLFNLDLQSLQETMRQYEEDPPPSWLARTPELCFMALTGYFEAFCKNHYASIINVCPNLVERMTERHQAIINVTDLLQFGAYEPYKLGFLLAERNDFGSARKVNALYLDLLQVTPFSQATKQRYDDILRDRNLLIHHGGIYTPKYLRQTPVELPAEQAVFFHSLEISASAFTVIASFLETIALAIVKKTQTRLREEAQMGNITLTELGRKAEGLMYEAEGWRVYAKKPQEQS